MVRCIVEARLIMGCIGFVSIGCSGSSCRRVIPINKTSRTIGFHPREIRTCRLASVMRHSHAYVVPLITSRSTIHRLLGRLLVVHITRRKSRIRRIAFVERSSITSTISHTPGTCDTNTSCTSSSRYTIHGIMVEECSWTWTWTRAFAHGIPFMAHRRLPISPVRTNIGIPATWTGIISTCTPSVTWTVIWTVMIVLVI